MTDIADLLLLAQLSNAAYIDNEAAQRTAVAVLGFEYLSRYENVDHQAFICRRDDRIILAISGTRFSDGNVHELLDDEDVLPVYLAPGIHVMQGFHAGMAALFSWALQTVPAGPIDITGHSLGGARTHLAPIFILPDRIGKLVSFAAPKAANRAYWDRFQAPLTRIVNSRDLWAGWPFLSEWCQPEPMLWLNGGQAQEATETRWPGGLRASDHSITDGYIAALQRLAHPSPIPSAA